MKRFALAVLAALAAVVASEQQAKAWFNFGIGSSTNMNVSWGGHHGHCGRGSEPWPTQSLGVPNFNYYGPAPSFPPYYPGAGGYGYSLPYGQPGYTGPMPQGSGSGSGSGSPIFFAPVPMVNPYIANPYDNGIQNAYYQTPYWYGR
jgi:hypothetical protein